MTRSIDYPAVDPRRVTELRRALLRDIAAMAPAWQGAHEETGADRALVEAASRLAEEATKRLDRTPERDALAFLEMFDVPPPKPVAAEGVVVVALKADRASPVSIEAGTGIEIEAQTGDKVPFETKEDLRIQPAQIERLATVDPRADQVGIAPDAVTTLEPDLTPRPSYSLATFAGPEARVITLTPPLGIEAGDLLRFGAPDGDNPVYAVVTRFSDDGLTELEAPLGREGLAAETPVERMTRLDAFAMPDQQEHGLYIGDADVLNVKEPATLTLCIQPSGVAPLLRAEGVRFEIFGTREQPVTDEEPGWWPLVPLAAPGDDLVLLKAWTGPIDELEIGGKKARWLRIIPAGKLVPDDDDKPPPIVSGTNVEQIKLGILTEKPEGGEDDTVGQVAHNGLPLSDASSFLPFGPEPQRFDSFALAAPEAFTKPGATAVLDFELLDATMLTVSQAVRFDAKRHLYGIGRNGRLQVMQLGSDEVLWREFSGPGEEEGSEKTQRLDPAFGVHAFGRMISDGSFANDLVVVRTESGELYTAGIDHKVDAMSNDDSAVEHKGWQQLPDLPEGALEEEEIPALVAAPRRQNQPAVEFVGFLYAAARSSLHFMQLNNDGGPPVDGWQVANMTGDAPDLPTSPRFVHIADPAQANAADENDLNPVSCLTVDSSNNLWIFFASQENVVRARFEDNAGAPLTVVSGAQPAGLLYNEGESTRIAVAAITSGGITIWKLERSNSEAEFLASRSKSLFVGAGSFLAVVPGLEPADTDFPHVLAFDRCEGEPKVLEWAPSGLGPAADEMSEGLISTHRVAQGLLPSDEVSDIRAAVFAPEANISHALVVLGGADQSVLQLRINPSYRPELFDWIEVPEEVGFSKVRIIRSTSDGRELILNVGMAGKDQDGIPIAIIGERDTDWSEPVEALRSGDGTCVTLEPGDILHGDPNTASDALVGALILVVPDESPDPGIDPFRQFTVVAVDDDRDITVDDPSALVTLMVNAAAAEWYHISPSTALPGGSRNPRRLSLVEIPAVPVAPDFIGPFERADVMAPVLRLNGTDGQFILLAGGWPGSIEQGQLIKAAFADGGAEATMVQSLAAPYSNPGLSWEYFNGDGWRRLDQDFRDTTADFAKGGEIAFTVPNDLHLNEIGGQEDYWIRARLIGGDYGRPRYIVEQRDTKQGNEQEVTVRTDHMRPPEIYRVTAHFQLPPVLPAHVVARNNLRDLDQTSANGLANVSYAMFQGAFKPPLAGLKDDDDDPDPYARAVFLGLTRPLETGSASLFVVARDQADEMSLEISTLGADNLWSPAPLTDEDPTKGLNRTGLLRFAVTTRPAHIQLFGAALHWLRIRAVGKGAASWAPRIEGMWLNGVPVVQAETVRHEPLGSADGEPGFEVQLLKTPVLPESLELRVRERLGDEEIQELREAGGADAVLDDVPNLPGQWVRWTRVDSLADQPGNARVYLADASGSVQFGDGQNGRLVLAGRDNLRAFSYRSGGQRVETDPFAAAGPRGSIEALEVVLAPSPIAGGRDQPSSAELVARMPDVLRHAGQGLSLSDIEALAKDSDSEIVQVRAFQPTAGRNSVLIAVLSRGKSRVPVYSRARRDALRKALSERVSDAWHTACLDVVSVDFVKVGVEVRLIASPGELAALESQAKEVLDRFLHAAEGGPDGEGWPPGRALWPTDIRRVLAGLPALDQVEKVTISLPDERVLGEMAAHEVITAAETRRIKVIVEREAEA